jgi:hypothetical protein
VQARLRKQNRRIHEAGSVRAKVEAMLDSELEEGTHQVDKGMSTAQLDKRKQRIKDWLGQLVRLELAQETRALAKAKLDMAKKADGEGVLVNPGLVLDHRAMMNLFEKRPDVYALFEEERNAIESH